MAGSGPRVKLVTELRILRCYIFLRMKIFIMCICGISESFHSAHLQDRSLLWTGAQVESGFLMPFALPVVQNLSRKQGSHGRTSGLR